MARRPTMRRSRAASAALVLALPMAMHCASRTFVPAPRSSSPAVAAASAAAAVLAPLAAHAELPPLEDLPLEGLKGGWVQEREAEVVSEMMFELSWFGVKLPVALLGLPLFLLPPMLAAMWAYGWVTNTDPFDAKYKTYLGAGDLPPEGYTNPLDPRMSEAYDVDDDDDGDLPKVKKSKRKTDSGSTGNSAVV